MAELPPDVELPASVMTDLTNARERLLIAKSIPLGDAHVPSDFTEKGRAEYLKRSSRVLSDDDETFTLGETIKLEEQLNEQELLRSAAQTFTLIIFNSAIVHHALQQHGSSLHEEVRKTMPVMLKRTSLCMDRARSPHLTLEMRLACALTAGDEAVNFLLGTPSRRVKTHAELASMGAHFLRTVNHMYAHGIFMRERIYLQSQSQQYRRKAFEDPANYWGVNGEGVNRNFKGVKKGLYMRTFDLFGRAFEYVERAIRMERQERMNEYFSAKTKANESHLTARAASPTATQKGSAVMAAFSQVAEIKRAIHTLFRGTLQYIDLSPDGGSMTTFDVLSDFSHRVGEPGGWLMSREQVGKAADVVTSHLEIVSTSLFRTRDQYHKFLKYLTIAENHNGKNSRFHRRLNFWADVFFHLFTSPLMLTDAVKVDGKSLRETRPTPMEAEERKKFYRFATPEEVRTYRLDLKRLCDGIVELGNLSDLVMQMGTLYVCMEHSFRSNDVGFQKMMQVAAEQRNHNARVVRNNEERNRIVAQTLLVKFGAILEHKDKIAAMIGSGTVEFPVSAKMSEEDKQAFIAKIAELNANPHQVLSCLQQKCINMVEDNTRASGAQMRQLIMYEPLVAESNFSAEVNVFKAGFCSGWVKRLPLEVFFWPNMAERKKPVEFCTAMNEANPTVTSA